MKTKVILQLVMLSFAIFLASCVKEGPAGLAGLDGADGQDGLDGQDGNVTCLACHSGNTISSRQFQYASSVHKAGTNVAYAGGRAGCAECHSSEGFIEYHANGSVDSDISMPSAINCETCHTIHTTFEYTDFALRSSTPVAMKIDAGTVIDLGDGSNLCINCHQARTAEPNTASPGETFRISSTHYGPHHGPQVNVFAGIGFAEIAGPVDYPVAGTSKHYQEASCTVCHMGDYVDKQGGHTFNPSLAACNECHSTTSFDYGGVQFDVEEKLVELRDLLVGLNVVAWSEADGAFEPNPGTYPMIQAQAYYNWIGLEEDRSLGVHNPQYVNALLTNTIEALKVVK
ncbi:MAG: hypothetical protein JW729_09640 [Bacteroidales bacterium]|nr:hypothetical protein [Bacteroidales bacterium]